MNHPVAVPGGDRIERVQLAWLTARRAGVRRSAARVRRVFLLRFIYPRFAALLYPLRPIPVPQALPRVVPEEHRGPAEWTGTISLLHGEPFALRPPVDWFAQGNGHMLWRFRLHEWAWALPLIRQAQTDPNAGATLTALLTDYISRVPPGHRIAYEPYPLSRRLVVWGEALSVLCGQNTAAGVIQALASEMDRGARMLAGNIEHDLDNNHVIANALALAVVGTLLDQPYGPTGFQLLWEQLRLQVRDDGGHVENSTTYHFLVWRDAVTACLLAKQGEIAIPADILSRLARMRDFLDTMRRSDGSFPLWNDSVQDEFEGLEILAASFEQNFPAAAPVQNVPSLKQFGATGYAVWHSGETHLVFDAGALGPTYCPGHGHADTNSFELFAYGQPRIIDAGTYQYEAGALRDYFRGTAAHNTLEVDGLNSSELQGSFRVGRMANARLWQQDGWVCGEHDGYTRLPEPVTHTRKIQMRGADTILLRDEIRGRGSHTFALRFHLAPGAVPSIAGRTVVVRYADHRVLHLAFENAPADPQIVEGWYSPTWYTRVPVPVIVLHWQGPVPVMVETRLKLKRD